MRAVLTQLRALIVCSLVLLGGVLLWSSPAVADCASSNGCWCGDGNCPTLGCCGGDGQRVCVTGTIFSSCSAACRPPNTFRLGACRAPCSYCTDTGVCCGDKGQTACVTACGGGCKAGLYYNAGGTCQTPPTCTYGYTTFGNCCGAEGQAICPVGSGFNTCGAGLSLRAGLCRLPCSYCDDVGICCGDLNQTACLAGSTGQASCTGNGGCKTGTSFHSSTATCGPPCTYCDDVGICCGAIGQTACLAGSIGQASCTGNGGCAPGLHFDALYGECAPAEVTEQTYLNGSDKRPFYIWGHNPNTPAKVDADLAAGANALEPDITVADDGPCGAGDTTLASLVMEDSSSPYRSGLCYDTHLVAWLDYVHAKALTPAGAKLALVEFDIKTSAATGAYLTKILDAIRAHLTYGPLSNLSVLLNVGSVDDGKTAFASTDFAATNLRPAEGVIIDGDDDPVAVKSFFDSHSYSPYGYGDGTALNAAGLSFFGVKTRSLDQGVFLRASLGRPHFIAYAFLLNSRAEMRAYINAGVDGIIPGSIDSVAPVPDTACQAFYKNSAKYLASCALSNNPTADLDASELQILVGVVNEMTFIRPATRDDNPFAPKLQSYGLEVSTPANSGAPIDGNGTDADLTFTLTGCKGSAKMTVNAGFIIPVLDSSGRMEAGNADHVTIPSMDLGILQSITIDNDGTGAGPDWTFSGLRISSAGWLLPDEGNSIEYQALGVHTLPKWQSITLPLTPTAALSHGPGPFLSGQGSGLVLQCPDKPVFTAPTACNPQPTITFRDDTVQGAAPGTYRVTRTWTGTDAGGQAGAPVKQTIAVVDTLPPAISCPANVLVAATDAAAPVTFTATATDACAATTTITYSHDPGSIFPAGTTTVSATATDPSGNHASCTFAVVVGGAGTGVDGGDTTDGAPDTTDGAPAATDDGATGSDDGSGGASDAAGLDGGTDDGGAVGGGGADDGGAVGGGGTDDGGAVGGSGPSDAASGGGHGGADVGGSADAADGARGSSPASSGCGCSSGAGSGSGGLGLLAMLLLCGGLTSRRGRARR
jgi:hypothetical protein